MILLLEIVVFEARLNISSSEVEITYPRSSKIQQCFLTKKKKSTTNISYFHMYMSNSNLLKGGMLNRQVASD